MRRFGLAILLLFAIAAPLHARSLSAAGDGADLWLVVRSSPEEGEADKASALILHRRAGDPPGELHRLAHLRGRVHGGGVATGEGRLWLVYDDLTVQTLSPADQPRRPTVRRSPLPRVQRQLPAGVKLRSLAISRDGPWALVHVEDAATLQQLDAPPPEEDDVVLPPAMAILESDNGEDEAPAEAVESPEDFQPQDRLLRLRPWGWQSTPLPDDWPDDARGWLVQMRPGDARPRLIAMPRAGTLAVYTFADDAWRRQDYQLDIDADAELRPIAVDEQLVIGRLMQADEQVVRVALSVLRSGKAIDLGTLSIDDPPTTAWGVAPSGQMAALIVLDQTLRESPTSDAPFGATSESMRLPGALRVTMDLQGNASPQPQALRVRMTPTLQSEPNQLLIVAVMCLAMLILLRVWRRDPYGQHMTLPDGVGAADLTRRTAAAAIDLAPCVVVVMFLFDIAPARLGRELFEAGEQWSDQWPRMTVIGLNVLHTLLTEMFTARSLGKWAMGLRVVVDEGKPPDVWQVIARNLLRAFDLIAWYVLPILVIITPYHQRLGDMLARTVVVMNVPAEDKEQ